MFKLDWYFYHIFSSSCSMSTFKLDKKAPADCNIKFWWTNKCGSVIAMYVTWKDIFVPKAFNNRYLLVFTVSKYLLLLPCDFSNRWYINAFQNVKFCVSTKMQQLFSTYVCHVFYSNNWNTQCAHSPLSLIFPNWKILKNETHQLTRTIMILGLGGFGGCVEPFT